MAEDDNWLSKVLWTDEAIFVLRGSVSFPNCRIWATENPRTFVQTPLRDEKVMMGCGFTSSTFIGPFFFEEMLNSSFETVIMTGERYADMLQHCIIPSLADNHLLESTTFIQNGSSPYIDKRVKDLFRRLFGNNRVLNRHFRYAWPSRSPSMSPCDYWLWGYLKSQIYCNRHQ